MFQSKEVQQRVRRSKYTSPFLMPFRDATDPFADAVITALDGKIGRNLLARVEIMAETEGGVFQEFLDVCLDVPKWADFAAMEPGRRISFKYAPLVGAALLAGSLVEGYALGNAAKVLIATGRLNHDASRRIQETSEFVYQLGLPRGVEPGREGHRVIMKVRLLHAAVRYHLMQKRQWDTKAYGAPINQEDMAFTLIEFGYIVRRGLARLGVVLTEEEEEAHHLHWRYVGHVLGIDDALLTKTRQQELALYHAITRHQRNVTEDSILLAHSVLDGMAGMPPLFVPRSALHQLSRRLLGNELADELRIPYSHLSMPAMSALKLASSLVSRAQRRIPLIGSTLYHAGGIFAGHAVINSLGSAPPDYRPRSAQ